MKNRVNITSATFQNIFSIGNVPQRVEFKSGVWRIDGVNNDKGGSSGAGKTSIMNAISFALYGEPFDPLVEDIQNYSNSTKKTPASVVLEFSVGDDEYRITRNKVGSSGSVSLCKREADSWPDITLGKGVQATNKMIVDLIGIDFDLFALTCVFSGNIEPFLKRKAADQRRIIETLYNAAILTEYAEHAKELKTALEADLRVQNALLDAHRTQVVNADRKRAQAKQNFDTWERNRERDLNELRKTKELVVDYDHEIEIIEELASLSKTELEIRQDCNRVDGEIRDINKKITTAQGELRHLDSGECPYCLQAFKSEDKIRELNAEIDALKTTIAELTEVKKDHNIERDEILSIMTELNKTLTFKTVNDVNAHKLKVSVADAKIQALLDAVNPYDVAVSEPDVGEFDMSKLDQLTSELEHAKLLIQLFTNRDSVVRTSIIKTQTELLNNRIQYYCKLLDLPQVLHFDPNMKCSVMEFGRKTSYGNLSAGERRRANLALSYAFRDLVNVRFGGINLLMIDEIDGGSLDAQACVNIVGSLRAVAEHNDASIFVISHMPEIAQRIQPGLTVTKDSGFSTITQST